MPESAQAKTDLERPSSCRLGLSEMLRIYGVDTAVYLQSNLQMACLIFGMFCAYFVQIVVFGMYDLGTRRGNTFILVIKLATGHSHQCIWCLLLLVAIFYFWTCKLMRMSWDYEQRVAPAIEDFSVVLYNIPCDVASEDVVDALNAMWQRKIVKSQVRVKSPSLLRLKMKFIKLQKQYFEQLNCNAKILYQFDKAQYNRRRSTIGLRFSQLLGYNRDGAYYEAKLSSLQSKIEQKMAQSISEKEALIVSVETVGLKCDVLSALQKRRLVVQGSQISCKNASSPADMNYPNVSVDSRKKIWVEILNYVAIVLIIMLVFFVTSLARDLTDRKFNLVQSRVGRFILKFVMISLVMAIPICFQGVVILLVQFERHMSFSKRNRSMLVKLFLLKFASKMTIIYSTDFSDLVLEGKSTFFKFVSIFSSSAKWRFSLDSTGVDLLMMAAVCLLFDSLWPLLYHSLSRWYAQKVAISQYDQMLAEKGLPLREQALNANKLVMLTLCLAFGFWQPWLLPIGVVYMLTLAFVVRFIFVHLASRPARTSSQCVLLERLQSVVVCGCFVPQLQFDPASPVLWAIFFTISVLLNVLLNTDIFNALASRVLRITNYYNTQQYKKETFYMFDSYFFEERYELAQALPQAEVRRMQKLISGAKQEILAGADSRRSSVSVRGQNWAKNAFEVSDAVCEGTEHMLQFRDSASDVREMSDQFVVFEEDL